MNALRFSRKFNRAMLWLLLLAGPTWSLVTAEMSTVERATAAKMGGLVEQSGFRSKKFSDSVWAVFEKGKSGQE